MTTITVNLVGDTVILSKVTVNPVTRVEVISNPVTRINYIQYPIVSTNLITGAPVIRVGITTGARGLQGPPGPPGGQVLAVYPAGENLSSGRGVWINNGEAFYFQPSDANQIGLIFGITTTSALAGQDVTIQPSGELSDLAFNFALNEMLWFSDDGEIVNVAPLNTAAILQKAGIYVDTNKIKIDFSIQILT